MSDILEEMQAQIAALSDEVATLRTMEHPFAFLHAVYSYSKLAAGAAASWMPLASADQGRITIDFSHGTSRLEYVVAATIGSGGVYVISTGKGFSSTAIVLALYTASVQAYLSGTTVNFYVYFPAPASNVSAGAFVKQHGYDAVTLYPGATLTTTTPSGTLIYDSSTDLKQIETTEGGVADRYVAYGSASRGQVASIRQGGTALQVNPVPVASNETDMPIGVYYTNVTNGQDAWIVNRGTAYAMPESTVTAAQGYVGFCSTTQAGRLDQAASIGAAQHWREVTHWMENGSGAGAIARANLHFN